MQQHEQVTNVRVQFPGCRTVGGRGWRVKSVRLCLVKGRVKRGAARGGWFQPEEGLIYLILHVRYPLQRLFRFQLG